LHAQAKSERVGWDVLWSRSNEIQLESRQLERSFELRRQAGHGSATRDGGATRESGGSGDLEESPLLGRVISDDDFRVGGGANVSGRKA
jgi:hypothetical protein